MILGNIYLWHTDMQFSQFYCRYWSSLSVFYENLIIYVWPWKSFPTEKPKPSMFSLLLNSSLMEFLNELLIRQFWASASSCEWLTLDIPLKSFFVKMTNSLSLVVFCSSGTCYNLITLGLQASAFRFSGMCTVEAAWSCMLFQCCVFVVFLLCCSFSITNMEFLSHSSTVPLGRDEQFSCHSLKIPCDSWSLKFWSICGDDCFSSGGTNFEGSIA